MAGLTSWWFYTLLSVIFAAITTIFAKIGVDAINSNLATAIRTIVILIVVWGIVFAQGNAGKITEIAPRTLLFLVFSGIATGLSWICYFKALQIGKASLVAPIDKSSLVLVLIFSALFLGEPLSIKALLGTALVVFGTLVLVL